MKTEKFADEWIAMYGVHEGIPREGSDEEDKDSCQGKRRRNSFLFRIKPHQISRIIPGRTRPTGPLERHARPEEK